MGHAPRANTPRLCHGVRLGAHPAVRKIRRLPRASRVGPSSVGTPGSSGARVNGWQCGRVLSLLAYGMHPGRVAHSLRGRCPDRGTSVRPRISLLSYSGGLPRVPIPACPLTGNARAGFRRLCALATSSAGAMLPGTRARGLARAWWHSSAGLGKPAAPPPSPWSLWGSQGRLAGARRTEAAVAWPAAEDTASGGGRQDERMPHYCAPRGAPARPPHRHAHQGRRPAVCSARLRRVCRPRASHVHHFGRLVLLGQLAPAHGIPRARSLPSRLEGRTRRDAGPATEHSCPPWGLTDTWRWSLNPSALASVSKAVRPTLLCRSVELESWRSFGFPYVLRMPYAGQRGAMTWASLLCALEAPRFWQDRQS